MSFADFLMINGNMRPDGCICALVLLPPNKSLAMTKSSRMQLKPVDLDSLFMFLCAFISRKQNPRPFDLGLVLNKTLAMTCCGSPLRGNRIKKRHP